MSWEFQKHASLPSFFNNLAYAISLRQIQLNYVNFVLVFRSMKESQASSLPFNFRTVHSFAILQQFYYFCNLALSHTKVSHLYLLAIRLLVMLDVTFAIFPLVFKDQDQKNVALLAKELYRGVMSWVRAYIYHKLTFQHPLSFFYSTICVLFIMNHQLFD